MTKLKKILLLSNESKKLFLTFLSFFLSFTFWKWKANQRLSLICTSMSLWPNVDLLWKQQHRNAFLKALDTNSGYSWPHMHLRQLMLVVELSSSARWVQSTIKLLHCPPNKQWSAVNKSQQHQKKISWERWESNPGHWVRSEKAIHCAMRAPKWIQPFYSFDYCQIRERLPLPSQVFHDPGGRAAMPEQLIVQTNS